MMNVGMAINSAPISKLGNKNAINFKGSEIIDGCFDDKVVLKKPESKHTKEEKQEIVRSSLETATGWSIFFGIFSTLYFGLRSDKTVAEKYNLDEKADAKLIKQIKSNQTLWTLASMIPFIGVATGIGAWLYMKNKDASEINVN